MYAWRKCTLFCVKKVCGMFAGLRKISTFASAIAEIAQLVEHNLAKVRVASSSFVFRSFTYCRKTAEIAQLVEHNLAKVRVASSSLVFRSFREIDKCWFLFFYVISLLLLADNIYICARNI